MRQRQPARVAIGRGAALAAAGLMLAGAIACGRGEPEPVPQADQASRRSLPVGEVVGYTTADGAHAWRGLPFARPPTGELRWRAPERPEPWSGVRQALEFGASCVQFAGPMGGSDGAGAGDATGSEDCLYLNVFAPRFEAGAVPGGGERLPVMVWIHGGGNTIGDARLYEASVLAERERLIVVTLHYRLGVFGWLSHPALHGDGASAADRSGNYGTLDIVRALHWVRENIAAFGGDPGRVTVFGESAGGTNTYTLLLSPLGRSLFQRAIVQSGGLATSSMVEAQAYRDAAVPGHERSSGELLLTLLVADGRASDRDRAKALVASLGPDEIGVYLRAKSAPELLAAYSGERMGGMYSMPKLFRDGRVLPADPPLEVLARGDYNRVPTLVGTNRDETKLFAAFTSPHVRHLFGFPIAIKNGRMYDATTSYGTMMWKATGVDEPAAAMSRAQGASVFAYRFDWDDEPTVLWLDMGELIGAAHALEIPFVFGRLSLGPATRLVFDEDRRASDERLSRAMTSYWAQHAYTGSPGRGSGGDLPEWRPWSAAENPAGGFIVLDSDRDGGIRMSTDVLTRSAVLERVEDDDRLLDASERCEVYALFVERGGVLSVRQYEQIEGGACRAHPLPS